METYNNEYRKEEDFLLWEIHEIRHALIKEYSSMTSTEINNRAKDFFEKHRRKGHYSGQSGPGVMNYGNSNI